MSFLRTHGARLLPFAVLFACLVVGAQRASSQSAPSLEGGWFGPGTQHTLLVDEPAGRVVAELSARDALLWEFDYGPRRLLLVDEVAFGGRAALRDAGLPIRDEQRLIPINGFALDTLFPELTLAQLDVAQRAAPMPEGRLDPTLGLYLVQFVGPVHDGWLERLDATGARRIQFHPMNAYVVQADAEAVARLEQWRASDPAAAYVGEWHPGFRLAPELRAILAATTEALSLPATIQLVDTGAMRDTLADLVALSFGVEQIRRVGPYTNVDLTLSSDLLTPLSQMPQVFAIELRGERVKNDERQGQISAGNVSGAQASAPGYLAWLASKGFNSSQFGSFSVNVVDDSANLSGHPDLPGSRIAFGLNPSGQGSSQDGHGFLNAHIVAGFNSGSGSANEDAQGYNYGLGIAPWARVGATAIFGPSGTNPASYESDAYNLGARISTNSWSFIDGNEDPIPNYDSNSQQYDSLVRDVRSSQGGNQEYMIIFSSGNDGPGANSVSTPATAKNILTVGASENWRPTGTDGCGISNTGANDLRDIISFSSQGPVNASGGDGRWKPEIVAQGTHVQAGVPQSGFTGAGVCDAFWPSGQTLYGWSSGTSHSTPAIAGAAALVRQWFLNNGMSAPTPAMNKALLVNTAEYLTGAFANDTLPSQAQGMGRMNLGRTFDGSARLFEDQGVVLDGTGDSHVVAGVVDDVGEPFRVTLVWTDRFGPTTGAPFVNDLDLTVNIGGNSYRGNVFAGANSTTGGSADFRNNTESVFLAAGQSGNFTVTVDASSIGGDGVPGNGDGTDQDFALVISNGTVAGAGPIAAFSATPESGIVPLSVDFTDQSVGNITSWAWTFGDGGTSSAPDPTHLYTSTGSYTVSLTVDGPDGPDTLTRTNLITVNPVPPAGVSDGGFESQVAGSTPSAPWSVLFGTGHVISPSGVSSDVGMPSEGTQWAELDAESTNNSTPPSNPGGVTSPASGGAGITQTFSYGAGQTELSFEATFMRNEDPDSQFNDWMSVDISDGSTTRNLFFKDTFSTFGGSSSKNGFPATPMETVTVDLAALYPSSTTSTAFTITAQVGNAVDDFQPSIGYVDGFRLVGGVPAPTAGFIASPTSGTSPLNVSFTDLSSGSISARSWSFGNGGASAGVNPNHTYIAAGTYTVSLTVTGPGGVDTDTQTDLITVTEPAPTAGFNATPTSGVSPLNVSFTDSSSGVITSRSWSFGDGGSSTATNPSYVYSTPGTYTVSLTVTGPGGVDTDTQTNLVSVGEPAPIAGFGASPTSGVSPLNVNFTDASSGAITLRSWDFGDGGSSTATNPSYVYTTPGTYTVSLTVTGPGGVDTDTQTDLITVTEPAPTAGFNATPTSGVSPLNVSFTDSSSGVVTSRSWSFGDGGSSTATNPNYVYSTPGTYTVSLTLTGPGGVDTDTQTDLITVTEPAPTAGFNATPTSGVSPLNVSFTDSSSGVVTSRSWSFGDGGSSTATNPNYVYSTPGTYTVSLTVTGPGGVDTDTQTNLITVGEPAPIAGFGASPTSGVSPLNVNFTDASSGAIALRSWDFGDGGSSTATNPSYVYTTPGTYTVSLTVTGPGGVDTDTQTNLITVGEPVPVADFSATPTTGLAPLDVDFTDASSGVITSRSWDFGDGNNSTETNPSHTYTSPGTYTVSLTVSGPGGVDTETKTDLVVASPNAFTALGGALAGTLGEPLLEGTGALLGNDPVQLDLTNALPGSSAFLVIGFSQINAPLKGGVLVPAVDLLTGSISTGGAGSVVLNTTWPAGAPSGFETFFQMWVIDAGGPAGFAASNAVLGTVP